MNAKQDPRLDTSRGSFDCTEIPSVLPILLRREFRKFNFAILNPLDSFLTGAQTH